MTKDRYYFITDNQAIAERKALSALGYKWISGRDLADFTPYTLKECRGDVMIIPIKEDKTIMWGQYDTPANIKNCTDYVRDNGIPLGAPPDEESIKRYRTEARILEELNG